MIDSRYGKRATQENCGVVIGSMYTPMLSRSVSGRGIEGEQWYYYVVITPEHAFGDTGVAPLSEFTCIEGEEG